MGWWRDFAIRTSRAEQEAWLYALVAIAIFAVGIGVNVTVFTPLVNSGSVQRGCHIDKSDRIVYIMARRPDTQRPTSR